MLIAVKNSLTSLMKSLKQKYGWEKFKEERLMRTVPATSLQIYCKTIFISKVIVVQLNLDMTDSMGPGKLVSHMQNPSYTYDENLICIGLGPSISSVICKNLSYSGPSYPSSPVYS